MVKSELQIQKQAKKTTIPPSSENEISKKKKYKGVRMRSWGSWVSEVRAPNQKTRIWLGSYSSAEAAARAYDAAILCLKGSSSSIDNLNFPHLSASIYAIVKEESTILSPKSIQRVAAQAANSTLFDGFTLSSSVSTSSSSDLTTASPVSLTSSDCDDQNAHNGVVSLEESFGINTEDGESTVLSPNSIQRVANSTLFYGFTPSPSVSTSWSCDLTTASLTPSDCHEQSAYNDVVSVAGSFGINYEAESTNLSPNSIERVTNPTLIDGFTPSSSVSSSTSSFSDSTTAASPVSLTSSGAPDDVVSLGINYEDEELKVSWIDSTSSFYDNIEGMEQFMMYDEDSYNYSFAPLLDDFYEDDGEIRLWSFS